VGEGGGEVGDGGGGRVGGRMGWMQGGGVEEVEEVEEVERRRMGEDGGRGRGKLVLNGEGGVLILSRYFLNDERLLRE